jgi:hypothetical protein
LQSSFVDVRTLELFMGLLAQYGKDFKRIAASMPNKVCLLSGVTYILYTNFFFSRQPFKLATSTHLTSTGMTCGTSRRRLLDARQRLIHPKKTGKTCPSQFEMLPVPIKNAHSRSAMYLRSLRRHDPILLTCSPTLFQCLGHPRVRRCTSTPSAHSSCAT